LVLSVLSLISRNLLCILSLHRLRHLGVIVGNRGLLLDIINVLLKLILSLFESINFKLDINESNDLNICLKVFINVVSE
jgi:hypothetical protein